MSILIKTIMFIFLVFIGICIFNKKTESVHLTDSKCCTTLYNSNYDQKAIWKSMPRQETSWGFQEIALKNKTEHVVTSIMEYKKLINNNTNNNQWKDNKVHIINFVKGTYSLATGDNYALLLVPSKTIIQGAGIGKTIFKAVEEIDRNDTFHFRRLFNLEYATHDVVLRGFSFYNETKDNKWGLFHANGARNRENYLFENIEFDDVFGAIGKRNYLSNFITFRGLRKRIGNTTNRIKNNFKVPIPIAYQFHRDNLDNVTLSGQLGVREGNGVVFHDCILGDNISATIDIYSNYVEIVGVKFINPLHDHAIKAPNGNHLYIHDSSFELNYKIKLIEGSGYWNPTFFTHEITDDKRVTLRKNYHFRDLKFIRKHKHISTLKEGKKIDYMESEPFTIYDEANKRKGNVSGDMVWENIYFEGYSREHQVLGYPNVQIKEGYTALNYTNFIGKSAQMKVHNNSTYGSYNVPIQKRTRNAKKDKMGVYSWGKDRNYKIDYPRNNRLLIGAKLKSKEASYILMNVSTMKDRYFKKITK